MKAERFDGIVGLDGPERYRHFVKSVVDREQAWGLYDDGWALAGLDDGREAFALWPEQEFAERCAAAEWAGYAATAISLDELVHELAPKLLQDGVRVAVFPTPGGAGVVPDTQQLVDDLQEEELEYGSAPQAEDEPLR